MLIEFGGALIEFGRLQPAGELAHQQVALGAAG